LGISHSRSTSALCWRPSFSAGAAVAILASVSASMDRNATESGIVGWSDTAAIFSPVATSRDGHVRRSLRPPFSPRPRRAIGWEPGARRRKQVLPGPRSDRRIGLLLFAQQPGIPEPPGSPPRPPADPTAPPPREDPPRPIPIPRPDEPPPRIDDPPSSGNSWISTDPVISKSTFIVAWLGAAAFKCLPKAVFAVLSRARHGREQPAQWPCFSLDVRPR
jgi:hypothetical protein